MTVRIKKSRSKREALVWLFILISLSFFMFPVYWLVVTSFKAPVDVFGLYFVPYLQYKPTLQNWVLEISFRGSEIMRGLTNSIIVGLGAAGLSLLIGSLTGYSLARFQFRRWKNRDIALWFLSLRILPPVVLVIPFFLVVKTLGLIDNPLAIILAHAAFFLPYAVLVTRDIFREIPVELEESARVDGCSGVGAFLRIAIPLAAPALAAAFILVFAFSWNEFIFALTFSYNKAYTLPVVVAGGQHTQGIQFWYVSVRTLVGIIPPMVLSLFAQRYIVRGLTMGAVKG